MNNITGAIGIALRNKSCPHSFQTAEQSPFIVSVRWRKRRDQPKAASKVYNVREPTPQRPDEAEFLKREYPRYNTKVKSVIQFLKSQGTPIVRAAETSRSQMNADTTSFMAKSIKVNDAWNAEIAAARALRLQEENSKKQVEIEQRELANLQKLIEQQEMAKRIIKQKEEHVERSISMDNLDDQLDAFLDQKEEPHGFAIDWRGKILKAVENKKRGMES